MVSPQCAAARPRGRRTIRHPRPCRALPRRPTLKLLFDFLPVVLFFVTFRWAEGHKEGAADFANRHLSSLFPGGSVGGTEAPVLLATLVVIVATALQVALLKARGKRVDTMLWVSLALVVVMGALTIALRNETFIKWKPTLLYWAMAAAFALGPVLFGKSPIRALLGAQFELPAAVWTRLDAAWAGFFAAMGAANLWVAFNFSTETWVNWKLFGGIGLLLAFSVAQALYLARHLKDDDVKPEQNL